MARYGSRTCNASCASIRLRRSAGRAHHPVAVADDNKRREPHEAAALCHLVLESDSEGSLRKWAASRNEANRTVVCSALSSRLDCAVHVHDVHIQGAIGLFRSLSRRPAPAKDLVQQESAVASKRAMRIRRQRPGGNAA